MTYKLPLLLVLLAGCLLLSACTPAVPIPVLEYGKMDASENKNLLILLRGRGGSYHDFEEYGIIDEVRKRDLPFDIVVPDAHFGYYWTETVADRLKYDIIDPARAKGYENIWLAGFSMGGLGSLFYLRNFPEDEIDGVILCSPFVGWKGIRQEIAEQGGIDNWALPENNSSWQYLLWGWVKEYNQTPLDYPPIYLGYSVEDRVVGDGPALLATALAPDHAFNVIGGHDYPTFQKLWNMHMDRLEPQLKGL